MMSTTYFWLFFVLIELRVCLALHNALVGRQSAKSTDSGLSRSAQAQAWKAEVLSAVTTRLT